MAAFVKSDASTRIVVRQSTTQDCLLAQDSTLGTRRVVVGPFLAQYTLTPCQVGILERLADFYTPAMIDAFLSPLISQKSEISLRALDWLVTNYSKKYNVACLNKAGRVFNIHQGYKVALTHYRRRNFDPFRRRLRISIDHGGETLETTVGQLNFMHWSWVNGVFAYAELHIRSIEADMNAITCESRRRRQSSDQSTVHRKRNELTQAADARVTIYHIDSTVALDHAPAADA